MVTIFVAAFRRSKMLGRVTNEEMLLAYEGQCLLPKLRHNDIIVMDNLPI
jgi:hypothetical protein